jgi:dihydroorotase
MNADTRTDTLTLTRPDDWHLHLRDGAALAAVLPCTAAQFGRAIVMPNLKPPVTTTAQALAYREPHPGRAAGRADFTPLMTLYLTDTTTPDEIRRAKAPASSRSSSTRPAPPPTATPASPTSARPTPRWKRCSAKACCCWCTAR